MKDIFISQIKQDINFKLNLKLYIILKIKKMQKNYIYALFLFLLTIFLNISESIGDSSVKPSSIFKDNKSNDENINSDKFNYLTIKLNKKKHAHITSTNSTYCKNKSYSGCNNSSNNNLSEINSANFIQLGNFGKLNIKALDLSILSNFQKAIAIEPIKIKNYYNMQYYGSLIVGSQKQEFSVIIDTGSNILWLPSTDCLECRNYTNKYNSSESLSSKNLNKTVNITYGKGFVEGNLFSDDVLIAENYGVKGMNFLAINKELDLDGTISDGLLGLGIYFEHNKNFSFIYSLYSQKLINKPAFTFYLTDSTFSNRLYLGDITENHNLDSLWSKMQSCDVNNSSEIYSKYWACDIVSISTSNYTLEKSNLDFLQDENTYLKNTTNPNNEKNIQSSYEFRTTSKAIFDTGSSLVFMPPTDFLNLIPFFSSKALDNLCTLSYGFQIFCKCKSPKDFGSIYLNFSRGKFIIDFESIIDYLPSSEYQCRFQIVLDLFTFDTWILGDSVLRYSFLTFDMQDKKISFLQNSGIVTDSAITGDASPAIPPSGEKTSYNLKFLLYFIIISVSLLFAYSIYACFADKNNNGNPPTNEGYDRLANN